jgi:hypothetical protein
MRELSLEKRRPLGRGDVIGKKNPLARILG